MRKLFLLIVFLVILSGCTAGNELICDEGFERIDDTCIETLLVCDDGLELIDGECKVIITCNDTETYMNGECVEDILLIRTIVTDDCDYLENLEEWQPVWCDEFDGEGLPDPTKWGYDFGPDWNLGEKQYYTYQEVDNVVQEDGVLRIIGKTGYYNGKNYSSAQINTRYSGDFLYGRFQIRAKVPSGKGPWGGIWMLPTDSDYGTWPNSGEIDILKYAGFDKDNVYNIVYTAQYNYSTGLNNIAKSEVTLSEEEFHLYEMIWEPGYIAFLIDGEQTYLYQYDPDYGSDVAVYDAWPFDIPFYLIMNVGIGGWGSEGGFDYSSFPAIMEIDYVRVYQKDYQVRDQSEPTAIDGLEQLTSNKNSMRLIWNKAEDDIMIKEYEVYVDDVFYDITSVPAIDIEELSFSTEYKIDVIAIDFAGHRSPQVTGLFATMDNKYNGERIEAEDFDEMQGIQTEITYDATGALNVGWVDDGDYLTYRLDVSNAGYYQAVYRVASNSNGGTIELYSDDDYLNTLSFETTNGWQNWITVTSDVFYLDEGLQTFKLLFTQSGCNINYFEFRRVN